MEEEQDKRLIKPEGFDISEVVNSLQGTCKTLSQVLESLYEIDEAALTEEDHGYIDNEIFQCNGCEWWYELSEQEDEGLCSSCYEYEEEQNEEGEEDE